MANGQETITPRASLRVVSQFDAPRVRRAPNRALLTAGAAARAAFAARAPAEAPILDAWLDAQIRGIK